MTARPRDGHIGAAIVTWPGGPHDFVLKNARLDDAMRRRLGGWPGWVYIAGTVVRPESQKGGWESFYAREVAVGQYEMLPKDCGPMPDGPPADKSTPHHGDHVATSSHLRA